MAKIEKMWLTPGQRPNGLQATDDGMWVIDAYDNHLYKLDWEDGSAMIDVPTETYKARPTETYKASGVTVEGDYVWVASTHNKRLYKLNQDGTTVQFYDPPGIGIRDPRDQGAEYVRPHGMEWVDGKMWVCIKPALRVYQVDPETMEVLHSIPTPGPGPHGIAWDNGAMWVADKLDKTIHKLDPENGEVLDEIPVPDPLLDGLTIHEGALIFCSEPTREVCRIEL